MYPVCKTQEIPKDRMETIIEIGKTANMAPKVGISESIVAIEVVIPIAEVIMVLIKLKTPEAANTTSINTRVIKTGWVDAADIESFARCFNSALVNIIERIS